MPQFKAFSRSLSLAALAVALATPALAVTADELWAEWQDQSASMGQAMTADDVTPGDGSLTLRGLTSTFSDGEVTTVARLDEVVMTENADGSVSIDMSDVYAINVSFIDTPSAPPVNIGINMLIPDLAITASGTADARVYDYSASIITLEEGEISGGRSAPPTIDMNVVLRDMTASYRIDGSDPENLGYTSDTEIGGITGAFDILPPPGEEGRLKATMSIGALNGRGAGQLGNLADVAANPDTVPAGFDLSGSMTYDSAHIDLTFEHPRDPFNLFSSNRGGSLSVTLSEREMAYRVTANATTTHFSNAEIPVPVEFSVGGAELSFAVPLAASPEPQPMSARLAYSDVVVSPQIWAMADPANAIPRDPMTVIADLSGSVRILTDLMALDPETVAAPPAELRDMTLNELRLSVGGATLTGTGSATFAPGPIPMPVGSVDLQLAGGNGLLDRLQTAGIVPPQQLAMVRGLLGAFARPGATPDTLESTIEFTEGGGITANGVPLQ